MALTFFYGSGSPYSWRVFLALEHKKADYEPRLLSFSEGEHRKPEFLAVNPRHKVPAIQDGDFSLYESSAMLEYLEERFPEGPRLFPGNLRERALIRRRISEADSYLGSANHVLVRELFRKSDPATRDRDAIEKAASTIKDELERLEASFSGPFLGPELSAADFTVYPFIVTHPRFELRDSTLGLSAAWGPETQAFMERIEALPYYDKTYPPHWRA